jgi:hypothetical protein
MADTKFQKSDWTFEDQKQLGYELLAWLDADPANNYLLSKFFNSKGILAEWIEDWIKPSNKHRFSQEFVKCYTLAKQVQEQRLAEKLINKGYATNGIITIMKNICGWSGESPEASVQVNISSEGLQKIKDKYFKRSNTVSSSGGNG